MAEQQAAPVEESNREYAQAIVCARCGTRTDGDDGRPTACCKALHTKGAAFRRDIVAYKDAAGKDWPHTSPEAR